jgi:hypothetical protein
MDPRIVNLFSRLRNEDSNFLPRPPQSPRQWCDSHSFKKELRVLIIPQPKLFVLGVPGPLIRRPLELGLGDIFETRLLKDVLEAAGVEVWAA